MTDLVLPQPGVLALGNTVRAYLRLDLRDTADSAAVMAAVASYFLAASPDLPSPPEDD